MTDLRFVVWQFVRLMVQLEESVKAGKSPDLKRLYSQWEDVWVDLDARLVDLGRKDGEAFAELMMNQEVVCETTNAGDRELVCSELSKVVDSLAAELAGTEDEQTVEDLSFEREELTLLIRDIRALKSD